MTKKFREIGFFDFTSFLPRLFFLIFWPAAVMQGDFSDIISYLDLIFRADNVECGYIFNHSSCKNEEKSNLSPVGFPIKNA